MEVLNATGRPGVARAGTLTLRRAGIDVVYFGNASETVPLDSTRIVVRRGSLDAGTRVRAALKVGRVVLERDSARLLDVTVIVGRDFLPSLDFHP